MEKKGLGVRLSLSLESCLQTFNTRLFSGGFLDQKSPFFQEEFPSLVSGGEEKSPQPKKEEEKEPQYGPGPSLRPQSKFKGL